jgi:hypothetical protein
VSSLSGAGGLSGGGKILEPESGSASTLHIVLPEDAPLLQDAPKRLGNCELLEKIGHGGMGSFTKHGIPGWTVSWR